MSAWGRGLAPLTVPVWYSYSPGGEIAFITPRDSRKARLIRQGGDKYVDATLAETERMIIVRVSPQRWLSHDETG